MTLVLAGIGWCVAGALFIELRRRSALLADAAHELRGPLTPISLGLESLRAHPGGRRIADALLAELGRLQVATDDVAAAARGRRARPQPRPLDPRVVVERTSEAWRAPARRRGGRVLVDWDAGARQVHADPGRLAQALGNLIANAVEHGGGDVTVRGRSARDAVRVEVSDRGDAPAGPRGPQTARGRGLVIARRRLEEAGGRLDAQRRPGGGRTAIVELPVERAR